MRVEGRWGADLVLFWLIGVLRSPVGAGSALRLDPPGSSRAVLPLSLAVGVDLSLSIVSLCLGRYSSARVTCIAEAGGRAMPPGCRRL